MTKLFQAATKDTAAQIPAFYNCGEQENILVIIKHLTFRQMGYNSRKPHWAQLLTAKKRESEAFMGAVSPNLNLTQLNFILFVWCF